MLVAVQVRGNLMEALAQAVEVLLILLVLPIRVAAEVVVRDQETLVVLAVPVSSS